MDATAQGYQGVRAGLSGDGQAGVVGVGVHDGGGLEGNGAKEEVSLRQVGGELASMAESERVPVVEVGGDRGVEIEPEVAEFVRREEKENLELERKVVHGGKTLVESALGSETPEVVLPMTKMSFRKNLGGSVWKSASWLAAWCFWVIKKFHGRVMYLAGRGRAGEV